MHNLYMVQDSQGRTMGVFEANKIQQAKDELLDFSYCILDSPEIRDINCPDDNYTIAAIFENGKRVFSVESGGFTVQRITANEVQ